MGNIGNSKSQNKDQGDNFSQIQVRFDIQPQDDNQRKFEEQEKQKDLENLQKQQVNDMQKQANQFSYYQKLTNFFTKAKNYLFDQYAFILLVDGMKKQEKLNFQQAISYYTRVIQIKTKTKGKQHPDITQPLQYMGDCYKSLKNYKQALKSYKQALKIKQKQLGQNHLDCVRLLDKIGNMYQKLKHYQKALQTHKKSLSIKQKILQNYQANFSTVKSLNGIGQAYISLNQFDQALQYFKKAQQKCETIKGSNSPQYAFILMNIGGLYFYKKQYETASDYNRKAQKILEERYVQDKSNKQTVRSLVVLYKNIAQVSRMQKNINQSIEYFEKALQISKYLPYPYAQNSTNQAQIYSSLAYLYQIDLKQYESSMQYLKKALKIYQNFPKTSKITKTSHKSHKLVKNQYNRIIQKLSNNQQNFPQNSKEQNNQI